MNEHAHCWHPFPDETPHISHQTRGKPVWGYGCCAETCKTILFTRLEVEEKTHGYPSPGREMVSVLFIQGLLSSGAPGDED